MNGLGASAKTELAPGAGNPRYATACEVLSTIVYAVTALFSHCFVVCLKVSCTMGNVMTDVRKHLQLHLGVHGERQSPYRFMLLGENQRVMESL